MCICHTQLVWHVTYIFLLFLSLRSDWDYCPLLTKNLNSRCLSTSSPSYHKPNPSYDKLVGAMDSKMKRENKKRRKNLEKENEVRLARFQLALSY